MFGGVSFYFWAEIGRASFFGMNLVSCEICVLRLLRTSVSSLSKFDWRAFMQLKKWPIDDLIEKAIDRKNIVVSGRR